MGQDAKEGRAFPGPAWDALGGLCWVTGGGGQHREEPGEPSPGPPPRLPAPQFSAVNSHLSLSSTLPIRFQARTLLPFLIRSQPPKPFRGWEQGPSLARPLDGGGEGRRHCPRGCATRVRASDSWLLPTGPEKPGRPRSPTETTSWAVVTSRSGEGHVARTFF